MELIKKHLLTILSAICIIALALPLASVEVKVEMFGASTASSTTVTGFSALQSSVFAYFLILGPVVLVAMNYIKQLEKYKGLLAIAVPAVCLVCLIIVVIQAKSFSASASNQAASAEVALNIGFGAILAGLAYIGTIVAGAVTYHNFTLDKKGLEKLKASAADAISMAQEKVSGAVQEVSQNVQNKQNSGEAAAANGNEPVTSKPAPRKATSLNRVDEILSLIEKLAQMKAAGILTEEEFAEKKKQLLEEIQ